MVQIQETLKSTALPFCVAMKHLLIGPTSLKDSSN